MEYWFLIFSIVAIFLPSMIIAMFVDESDLHTIPRIIIPTDWRWYNPRVSVKGLLYSCIAGFTLLLIWWFGLSSYTISSIVTLIEFFSLIIGVSVGFLTGNTVGYYLRIYTEDHRWRGKDSWHNPSSWVD